VFVSGHLKLRDTRIWSAYLLPGVAALLPSGTGTHIPCWFLVLPCPCFVDNLSTTYRFWCLPMWNSDCHFSSYCAFAADRWLGWVICLVWSDETGWSFVFLSTTCSVVVAAQHVPGGRLYPRLGLTKTWLVVSWLIVKPVSLSVKRGRWHFPEIFIFKKYFATRCRRLRHDMLFFRVCRSTCYLL